MSPVLESEGIDKAFSGIQALNKVSVSVDEGERVGLIGRNGAGKTTFFNCLLGILTPDGGTVRFQGRDISSLRVHKRARRDAVTAAHRRGARARARAARPRAEARTSPRRGPAPRCPPNHCRRALRFA